MCICSPAFVLFVSMNLAASTCGPNPSPTGPRIELLNGNLIIPINRTGSTEDLRSEVLSQIEQRWDANEQTDTGWYVVRSRSSKGECLTGGFRLRMRDGKTVVLEILDSGAVRQFAEPSATDWRSVESTLQTLLNDKSLNNLLNNGQ